MSIVQADRVVRAVLTTEAYGGDRFVPLSGSIERLDGKELVEGKIYRYSLLDRNDHDVALTVYLGLGEVGGHLWEQELRVLQRIGGLGHPSLPMLEGGGYVRPEDIESGGSDTAGAGFIRTKVLMSDEDSRAMATYFHERPAQAVRTLWKLADGLAVLHDSRIAHRNLWPGTLEHEEGDDGIRVLLARFEMSSMVSNLLRGSQIDREGAGRVRPLYLRQDPRFLAYTPPERVDFLLAAPGNTGAGDFPGDVFSLGVIAAEWLLGPDLLGEVPELGPELREFQKGLRRRVTISQELPAALSELLGEMLQSDPRSRPSMSEVMTALSRNYDTIAGRYAPENNSGQPYLVAYMREDSDRTLFKWGHLSESSMTDEGLKQLVDLIESDLRGATVCHSSEGAVPFVKVGKTEDRQRAQTVLFGHNFVWFAETLYRIRFGRKEYFDNIKVIKYVIENARASKELHSLRAGSLGRNLHRVEAVDHKASPVELEKRSSDRPSWPALLTSTAQRHAKTREQREYLDALRWFIDYQGAQLFAREYAYVREGLPAGRTVAVRWDRSRDADRASRQSSMHKKIIGDERLRLGMADFLAEEVAKDLASPEIEVLADKGGMPGDVMGRYRLVEVHGRETATLEAARFADLPERGWLRMANDRAGRGNLLAQSSAVDELENNVVLLQGLVRPTGVRGAPKWQDTTGGKLEGEGLEAMRTMLEHQSMFAVQGPPGTGKTEVTSQAVAEYLSKDDQARVLVSAQSHDALDNLAARILSKIGAVDEAGNPTRANWLAVRLASDFTAGNVKAPVTEFMPGRVVPRLEREIKSKLDGRGARRYDNPAITKIQEMWLHAVAISGPELQTRVRRGANLIFATTGASTKTRLVDHGSNEPFDWVVIEEAAKAWPTELALPLVRGIRWTLVGDQAQIGAFALNDVMAFLDNCRDDPDENVAGWWEMRDRYRQIFATFGHMFTEARDGAPRLELTEQRRMRKPIAEVVSRGFYSSLKLGGLKTVRPDRDHGLVRPLWARGRSLVWIDTGVTQKATGYWFNDVEAELVSTVVRSFEPSLEHLAADTKGKVLAIITPYRKQVERIQMRLAEHADDVWTVDSFQGREARIVIASLVRDRDSREAYAGLGHVADPARANVMLSRAQDLLVVVGRISKYEHCGIPEWEAVVAAARELGRVVAMSEVMPS
ncbi:AAA domain-containing protein [Amycolatopsis vastitatis]|uniref:Protein kinase domain-containing protein n=1 Tax=Amycolatopsis vastitatis TaxID=1905142 RepID=A0A229SPA8_9PSEU|nr:AAA domain-containing protein [Amycolatopsis vastitatis]OXM60501.1 hypothetical protein CF165_42535 [Amycolatopsis vastitatis]